MAGYHGYSMSNNAVSAYADGEMPLSKWTKAEILDACGDKAEKVEKRTVKAEVTYTIWVGQYRNYRRPQTVKEVVTFTEGDKMVNTSNGTKRMSSMGRVCIIDD